MILTIFPKKETLLAGDVGGTKFRVAAVAEDKYTVVKTELLRNAFEPILVTEFGIVMDTNELHPWNALAPILLTEVPKLTPPNDTCNGQPLNAKVPILVTEFGIVMVFNDEQPLNILSPIFLMAVPNEIVDNKVHP